MSYRDTHIWRDAFQAQTAEHAEANIQRLAAALDRIYQNSSLIANQIWSDQPGFTAHDATHLNAVWELADLIRGPELQLNPLEVFILGSAIFFHDLAMTLAALPLGETEITDHPSWRDTIVISFRRNYNRMPTQEEINRPSSQIVEDVTRQLLRERHAELAASLPTAEYASPNDPSLHLYLIEDPDLRIAYGSLIGKIAASHGWGAVELTSLLPEKVGAPYFAPISWHAEIYPIAMLLRCADAIHLDAGRAPLFTYATRMLPSGSRYHWQFHQHLQRPYVTRDRLVFSTARPFLKTEVEAWWLCVDTLRMVDSELRAVDVAMADLGKPRLRVRSVAGVQDLTRLASHIETEGWEPVDARVHIGDVASLVSRLGGEQLYGHRDIVALRELILNGIDAVKALAALADVEDTITPTRVRISVQETEDGWALTVDDNGVGMPSSVMTGALLDFGNSFWEKPEASRLYPGLQSRGFTATGRYGIGFFSVFMWGAQVKVISRSFYNSMEDTFVLEFRRGLSLRPIMRRAEPNERRPTSGTSVSVVLDDRFHPSPGHLTVPISTHSLIADIDFPLSRLVAWLIPASEVRLETYEEDSYHVAVEAGDWRSISGSDLLKRLQVSLGSEHESEGNRLALEAAISELGPLLRPITNESDTLVGRACLLTEAGIRASGPFWHGRLNGVVTVGGARTESALSGFAGLVLGESVRITREIAVPAMDRGAIVRWASESARLAAGSYSDPEKEAMSAEAVMRVSADTGPLALFQTGAGWLTQENAIAWATGLDRVRIVHPVYLRQGMENMNIELDRNVVVFEVGHYPALTNSDFDVRYWPLDSTGEEFYGFAPTNCLMGRIYEALVQAWHLTEEEAADLFRRHGDREKEEFGTFEGRRLSAPLEIIRRRVDSPPAEE